MSPLEHKHAYRCKVANTHLLPFTQHSLVFVEKHAEMLIYCIFSVVRPSEKFTF